MRLAIHQPAVVVQPSRLHAGGTPALQFRLTIIHPCIGRRPGQKYIRTWQMEPLPAATIAGLTPAGVEIRFYDDRMETIPFDEPADLVAISVETYTSRRTRPNARIKSPANTAAATYQS
jgi:hypothetical protein